MKTLVKPNKNQQIDCQDCEAQHTGAFSHLCSDELDLVTQGKQCNTYQKHQLVFAEGDTPSAIYCIRQGVVKLYRSAVDGRKQIIHLAKEGELIGYAALLSGTPYALSAETVETCEICTIDKATYFNLIEKSPQLLHTLLIFASKQLDETAIVASSLAQKTVRERIAESLLLLKEAYGETSSQGVKIGLKLTRQELADLSGTVLETAVRFLSEFKKDGYIDLKGRDITIRDPQALLKISGVQF